MKFSLRLKGLAPRRYIDLIRRVISPGLKLVLVFRIQLTDSGAKASVRSFPRI
jgi:hypothetical protein